MIKLHKFTFNPFQENTYLVWDEETKESMIVDPGCSNELEEKEIVAFLTDNSLNVKYLINTHCHIDHVLGNKFIKEKYSCKFYAPELDIPLLENVVEQAKMFGIKINPSPLPDEYINGRIEITDREL